MVPICKEAWGAKITSVDVQGADADVELSGGSTIRMHLDGDCCSSSRFTDPKQFDELVGATIIEVEERFGQSDNNLPAPEGSDVISWHFLVFKTDKGHVTIDWHNDSNGYYDGTLSCEVR